MRDSVVSMIAVAISGASFIITACTALLWKDMLFVILGFVIGGLCFLLVLFWLWYYLFHRKKDEE